MSKKNCVVLALSIAFFSGRVFGMWFERPAYELNSEAKSVLNTLLGDERYTELFGIVNGALRQQSDEVMNYLLEKIDVTGNPVLAHWFTLTRVGSLQRDPVTFADVYSILLNMVAVVCQAWIDGVICKRFTGDPAGASTSDDPYGANLYRHVAVFYGRQLATLRASHVPTLFRLLAGTERCRGLGYRLSDAVVTQWPSPLWVLACSTPACVCSTPDILKIAGYRSELAEPVAQARRGLSRLVFLVLRWHAHQTTSVETFLKSCIEGTDFLRALPAAALEAAVVNDLPRSLGILDATFHGISGAAYDDGDVSPITPAPAPAPKGKKTGKTARIIAG